MKRLSNGPMEDTNFRLKCIIKNANGYRNFNRFRNRCFFAINKNEPILGKPKRKTKLNNKIDFNGSIYIGILKVLYQNK